jgi:4-amino-4-deoxy-L-arabinose transferase-like glycosyltransferase
MLGLIEMVNRLLNSKINYPPGVEFIRNVYLFLVFLFPTMFIIRCLLVEFEIELFLKFLISFFIIIAAYYSINKGKSWAVSLILISSTWGLLNTIIVFLTSSSDAIKTAVKIILGSPFLAFYIYSLIVFTKKKTREFFKEKGEILI